MSIPDGEYPLVVPEALLAVLLDPSKARKNEEIFSFKYTDVPPSLDESSAMELTKATGNSPFELKAMSTEEHSNGIFFKGASQKTTELEYILVYNEKKSVFELEKLDYKRETTSYETKINNTSQKPTSNNNNTLTSNSPPEKPPVQAKKKRTKEASIFAPKARPKTPLMTNPKLKRAISEDDELPLAKIKKLSSSADSNIPSQRAITPMNSVPPLSTAMDKQANDSFDEEFGALADELEERMSDDDDDDDDDDGFFTIDERKPVDNDDDNNNNCIKLNVDKPGPISFRSLAGANYEEEDLSSSEEE